MLYARNRGLPVSNRKPIIVKCPLEKRSVVSRVVVKLKRRSVQWWTLKTVSSRNALMGALAMIQNGLGENPLV
jgi:hypothetical protein